MTETTGADLAPPSDSKLAPIPVPDDLPVSPPKPDKGDSKSPWNSLEVVKILVGVMIAAGAAASGFAVTGYFRDIDDLKARREAIQQLSRAILERRTRSSMLYESLKRQPEPPTAIPELKAELVQRKKDYDDAFVSWNVNLRGYYQTLRQAAQVGAGSPSSPSSASISSEASGVAIFEDYFQGSLTNKVFRPIDACLTSAYTQYLKNQNFRPDLERCQLDARLKEALNCGYALTEQLHLLTGKALTTAAAEAKVKSQCPALDRDYRGER